MTFQPIEDYGVIGNMKSVALVGADGSIDFLCYPDFDSPTIFAALLDSERGGNFQIESISCADIGNHLISNAGVGCR